MTDPSLNDPNIFFQGIDDQKKVALLSQLSYVFNDLPVHSQTSIQLSEVLQSFNIPFPSIVDGTVGPEFSKGIKTSNPVAALLAHAGPTAGARYRRLWSLTIAASFIAQISDNFRPTIKPACRSVYTLFGNSKVENILPHLPVDIIQAHSAINAFIADHHSNDPKIRKRLIPVRILFEKITNNRKATTRKKSPRKIILSKVMDPEHSDVIHIKDYTPKRDPASSVAGLEVAAERSQDEIVLHHPRGQPNDPKQRSPSLLRSHNSKVSQKIIQNRMAHWSNWNSMSLNC